MKAAASFLLSMLALGACVPSAPVTGASAAVTPMRGALAVSNDGAPFRADQGAAARKAAEAACAAQGLRLQPSIYDRFEGGKWHYREGCR